MEVARVKFKIFRNERTNLIEAIRTSTRIERGEDVLHENKMAFEELAIEVEEEFRTRSREYSQEMKQSVYEALDNFEKIFCHCCW